MTRRHRYQSPSRQRCDAFRILIAVSACFLLGVVVAAMPDYMYAGKTTAVKEYVPRLKDPRLLFMNIKAPRVVEFYSPTCPACRAFKKSYIKLSHNTKSLYPNIQFFAVSCDHHEDVCEEYDIRDFPTLRLFREDDGPSSKGKTAEFDEDDARSMRATKKIADFLGLNSVAGGKTKKDDENNEKSEKPLSLDRRKLDSSANDDDDDKEKNDYDESNDNDDDGVKKPNDEDKKNNNDKSNDNDDDGVKNPNDEDKKNNHDKSNDNDDDGVKKSNDEDKKNNNDERNDNDDDGVKKSNDEDKDDDDESNDNDDDGVKKSNDGTSNDEGDGNDIIKKPNNENKDGGKKSKSENNDGASNGKDGDNAHGEDNVKKSESTDRKDNQEGTSIDKGDDNADGEDIVTKSESTDQKNNEESTSNEKGSDNADGEDIVKKSESIDKTNNEDGASSDKGGGNADGGDIVKKSESIDKKNNEDGVSNKGGSNADDGDSAKKSESTDKDDDDDGTSNDKGDGSADGDNNVKKSESNDKNDDNDGTSNNKGGDNANNDDNVKQSERKDKNDDDDSVKKSESKDKNDDDDSVNKSERKDKNDDDDGTSSKGNGNDDDDDSVKKPASKDKKDDDGVKKSESEDKNYDDDDDNTSNDKGDGNKNSSSDEDDDDDEDIPNNYSEIHKRARENYWKKRQGLRKYLREDDTKDKRGKTIEKASFGDMTKGMKQYTPGTKEFKDRNQSINIRVQKGRRNNKFQGRTKAFTKASFPLRKDVTKLKWMKKMSNEEELILDVTLSLTTGLSAGMMMGIEDVTSKVAMKDWLDLLSVSLPPEWNVHKLIDSLRMDFEDATKSKARFQEYVKAYPIARRGWSKSCQNRKLELGGFSCGFWKLLHVVTLGVAEQRGGRNLIDSGMMSPTTVVFSPSTAADTIRNYMDKFFTCRPCRKHFLQTYDDCKNNRRCKRLTSNKKSEIPAEWKEISLWLWEFHNDVSVRLIGERISKTFTKGVKNTPTASDEVVGIWPNVNNCILCFEETGKWNDAEVFRFLERNYWPDSETDPLTDKLLKFESEGTSGPWMHWLGAFLFVWMIYKLLTTQGDAIRQPLISARLLYRRGVKKKMRVV